MAPQLARTDLPQVPSAPAFDYEPQPGMAHAALPLFDAARGGFVGAGRIWLKGSPTCRRARLAGSAVAVALEPPFYTAMLEAPGGTATVVFEPDAGPEQHVEVVVPDAARLNDPQGTTSALFYGDFQPFVIEDERVQVNPGERIPARAAGGSDDHTLVAVRRLLQAAAEGRVPDFPRPAFACGVGDQVYVEGDYHAWGAYGHRHPMSAWTVEAQPRPRVALRDLPRFLDTCYRAHWSFASFARALQACPTVMTWDDHDIRDGWGSQGDEYVWRDSYFDGFRRACVAHQFGRGPRPWHEDLARTDAPLWQSFTVGGVPVFVLDLRTCRDIAVPTVIGEEQWRQLRAWFASLDPARSRHYVLVSSVPIFYRIAGRASIAAAFSDEVRDDLLDTWTSGVNEPEWQRLVAEVATAGARGLRGIIASGDYHMTSLCRVTAKRDGADDAVIAYELITSGLASDGYGDWKQRLARDGWLLEAPIETGASALHTEVAFAPACPSFGGVAWSGDDVVVNLFQASVDGVFHERVPLDWSAGAPPLRTLLGKHRANVAATVR